MSLASGLQSVAKNLTKSLGTSAVLKDKTIGAFDPLTGGQSDIIADVIFNLASWEVSKPQNTDHIGIGDMVGIGYFTDDIVPNKEEKIVVNGEDFKIYATAKYQAQGETIAYKIYAKRIS